MTKIENRLEEVQVQMDQSSDSKSTTQNEPIKNVDVIALDSDDEDATCIDGTTSPIIQRSLSSRGSANQNEELILDTESENSNDCLFKFSTNQQQDDDTKISALNEKPERHKRRYDPSNPPLHSKSEVYLQKLAKGLFS